MHISYGVLLSTLTAIYLTPSAESVRCWICNQARSNRECIIRGFAKRCRPNDICESEIRYYGFKPVITKRCKQAQACINDQYQNAQISNGRSRCGFGQQNSVCRCCCNSDNCNRNQLTCNEKIKNPKCQPLYLPNGYTRCYGTADRLSLGTRCRFSCKTGYGVEGARFVSCRRRGNQVGWSGSLPTCKKRPTCATLQSRSFTNGIVRCFGISRIATLGTSCVYRCKPRYSMVNNNKRKTTANYERTVCTMLRDVPTWSKRPPICERKMCQIVTNVDHGFERCTDSNRVGSVCTFSCLAGYDLVGQEKVTCVQKTVHRAWDGRFPICRPKPCPIHTFNKPFLNVSCSYTNQFGSICEIRCNLGYYPTGLAQDRRSGPYTSTCSLRGDRVDWDRPAPSCEPKRCPRIRIPGGAKLQCTNEYEYLSSCTFSCPAPERVLTGPPVLTCTDDDKKSKIEGVWSDNLPTCSLKECQQLDSASTRVNCTNGFVYGSVCTFSCEAGYHMLANDGLSVVDSEQPTTTSCSLRNDEVAWSNAPPRCERQKCREFLASEALSVSCDDNEEIGSICSFTCQIGYDMIGKGVIECTEGASNQILGKWSDSPPKCQRKLCAAINHNQLTTDMTCTDDFKYESVCTLGCKEGYFMLLSSEIIDRVKTACLYAEGKMLWSEEAPTCRPKQCDAIRIIANGKTTCSSKLIFGAICEFSCDRGYDLFGSNIINCTDDDSLSDRGQWSSTTPTCEPRKCPSMGLDETTVDTSCDNGTSYRSVCETRCKPQHFIRDAQTRINIFSITSTCSIDNNDQMHWIPMPVSCQPVSCQSLENSALSSSCSNGNKTGSVCTFSCLPGYRVRGNTTNRCVSKGQFDADWSHPMPTCRVRRCASFTNNPNILRTCTRGNILNSTCSFTCRRNRGFYMTNADGTVVVESGTLESTCTAGDTNRMSWTEDLPKCNVKSCPSRSDPPNGTVRCLGRNINRFRSRCTYSCDPGYRRVGPFIITCLEGNRHSPEGAWSGSTRCQRIVG